MPTGRRDGLSAPIFEEVPLWRRYPSFMRSAGNCRLPSTDVLSSLATSGLISSGGIGKGIWAGPQALNRSEES
jgi:hypothetical protein